MHKSRRKTTVTMVLAAAGLGLVFAAPTASADIDSVTVASGFGFGTSTAYGTGCTYTVTAIAMPGDLIGFWDGRSAFDPTGFQRVGDNGQVTARWTPYATGPHQIWAYTQPHYSSTTTQVDVGRGIDLGVGCVVLP